MVIAKKRMRSMAVLAMSAIMLLASALPTFAAAPAKEDVEYKGKGKVEVEFIGNVNWKSPKVKVTDAKGKAYKVSQIRKDNDEISFVVKNAKAGTKYNFSISGVKKQGTKGFGTVKGTFKTPAAAKITKAKAKTTAINNAAAKYGINKNTVRDLDIEKDSYRGQSVWEVSFDAKKNNVRGTFEYDYKINAANGKILRAVQERD